MTLEQARKRTGSTMDVVPHLVIDIDAPGKPKKKRYSGGVNKPIDNEIVEDRLKPASSQVNAKPVYCFKDGRKYRYTSSWAALRFFGKGNGGAFVSTMGKQGYYHFADGLWVWYVTGATPKAIAKQVEAMEAEEGVTLCE